MKPFFSFFGGKWRAAPLYPQPLYGTIVEPFAGAAGYATRYAERRVILYDIDPVIAGLWQYLIRVSPAEILRIPLLTSEQTVDDLGDVAEEARHLVGFWLNAGTTHPCKKPSAWMRSGLCPTSYWGESIRWRIASQVERIRHWKVFNQSYESAPNIQATWFIDPPYQVAGKSYRHSSSAIDFTALAAWCRARVGQTLVCENVGATWLPFQPLASIRAAGGKRRAGTSNEALWTNVSDAGSGLAGVGKAKTVMRQNPITVRNYQ